MDPSQPASPGAPAPPRHARPGSGPGSGPGSVWAAIERDIQSALRGLGATLERLAHAELPRATAAELGTLRGTVEGLSGALAEFTELVQHGAQQPLARADFDPIELLEQIAIDLAPAAWSRGVEIAVHPLDLPPRVSAAAATLGPVLRRLLEEALDGAEPGRVELVGRVDAQGRLELAVEGGAPLRPRIQGRGRRALSAALFEARLDALGAEFVALEPERRRVVRLEAPARALEDSAGGKAALGPDPGTVAVFGVDERSCATTAALLRALGARTNVLHRAEDLAQLAQTAPSADGGPRRIAVIAVDEERWDAVRPALDAMGAARPFTLWLGASLRAPDAQAFARSGADLWIGRPLDRRRLRGALRLVDGLGAAPRRCAEPLPPPPNTSTPPPTAALPAPVRPAKALPAPAELCRALVALDHLVQQAELAAHLVAAGWDVVQVDDAHALERAARAGNFDALVYTQELIGLDPHKLGVALARATRADGRAPLAVRIGADRKTEPWPADLEIHARSAHERARAIRAAVTLRSPTRMGKDHEIVLDPDVIQGLRELDDPGAPSLLAELVEIFLNDAPARLAALEAALTSGDAQQLERVAHALKGSCGNLGAKSLAGVCQQIEQQGRAGRLEGMAPLVARSRQLLRDVKRALEHEVGRA